MKNGQSRDTGNIGYKRQDEVRKTKQNAQHNREN